MPSLTFLCNLPPYPWVKSYQLVSAKASSSSEIFSEFFLRSCSVKSQVRNERLLWRPVHDARYAADTVVTMLAIGRKTAILLGGLDVYQSWECRWLWLNLPQLTQTTRECGGGKGFGHVDCPLSPTRIQTSQTSSIKIKHTFCRFWQSSRPISLRMFFTALRAFRIFSMFPTGSWYIIIIENPCRKENNRQSPYLRCHFRKHCAFYPIYLQHQLMWSINVSTLINPRIKRQEMFNSSRRFCTVVFRWLFRVLLWLQH